ncbi:GTP pyrophosphokinase [Candidatus Pacearchaeota archaeon]|nr:GTP pyrophosphokinase [Candidatus Pacearchaeota archaeon]
MSEYLDEVEKKKTESVMLAKAIKVAAEVHEHQSDKAGRPYIFHCLAVMSKMTDDIRRIVAVMHDVIEDSPTIAITDIMSMGFSEPVVGAMACITRWPNQSYNKYIQVCSENSIVCDVKIADLEHNLDPCRFEEALKDKDLGRIKMYHGSLRKLRKAQQQWRCHEKGGKRKM